VFQSFAQVSDPKSIFPEVWTGQNYVALFTSESHPFFKWWFNTFIIALATAVLQTVFVLMTAYALSRLRFNGRKGLMKLILILGMFPGFLGMLVNYYILELLGINGSMFSLIIVYFASSAMSYYVAKGFFDTVSRSLDEAVMIDGGSKNTVFWRIILPLSKPIVIYTVLTAFMGPWGDFMFAKYIAHASSAGMTVAVGLQSMIGTPSALTANYTMFCAGGVVVAVPITILFMSLQKYYVEGVTGGAVKG
jgi:arabinogalactan oligomer/maltooligosaccharide transport system permease protein